MTVTRRLTHAALGLSVVAALAVSGCGKGGPGTHPVSGRVRLASGDPSVLAGSFVEAALAPDPSVRSAGEIRPDGSFTLESLHAGAVVRGAREGNYKIRVLLTDDDPASRQAAAKAVAPRFLKFETSGLTLEVPTNGEVQLDVSAK